MTTEKSAEESEKIIAQKLDQAWRILNLNQDLIRSADQKIYLLIVMSTILVTYVSTNLERIMTHDLLEKVILVLFLIAGACFFYFALITVISRAKSPKNKPPEVDQHLIFFGDVMKYKTPNDYIDAFHKADLNQLLNDVCFQIHQVANIAIIKYTSYRRAWTALLVEVSLFLLLEFSMVF